jgi:hypothetical protein
MKELEFYFAPFGYCTAVYDDDVQIEWDGDTGEAVKSAPVMLQDILLQGDSILADLSVSARERAYNEFLAEHEENCDEY